MNQDQDPQAAQKKSFTSRFVNAVAWRFGSNIFRVFLQLLQTVLLLRLLSVEDYGIFGYGKAIVLMTFPLAQFGLSSAFIHRDTETEDEQFAAQVYFSLNAIFSTVWLAALIGISFLFLTEPIYRWTIVVVGLSQYLIQISQTPRLILKRRIVHRRLSIIDTLIICMTTIVAVVLALNGFGIKSLLVTELVRGLAFIFFHYFYRPIWTPSFGWKRSTVVYYLRYGYQTFGTVGLTALIDRIDDYWVGQFLGEFSLGIYTRSYALARYPKLLLASVIDNIILGAYAELKYQREQLSAAFFRANAFLVRAGFLLAGLIAVSAEEIILILAGEKWLPMLPIFQIMLVFILLDPIQKTIYSLFQAMGRPELLVRIRFIQFLLLVIFLLLLGNLYGTIGVAIAVDVMVFIGIVYSLIVARQFVDFSAVKLFGWPTLLCALGIGAVLLFSISNWYQSLNSLLLPLIVKSFIFSAVYSLLFLFEYNELRTMISVVRKKG